jgi:cell division protein FtsB
MYAAGQEWTEGAVHRNSGFMGETSLLAEFYGRRAASSSAHPRTQELDGRARMKPFLSSAVKYFQLALIFVSISSVGVLMGEKGLAHKHALEEKKQFLKRENKVLALEIKSLERKVTLLRSDRRTIAKAAKRKLGMIGPDESVYIFDREALTTDKPECDDMGPSTSVSRREAVDKAHASVRR